MRLTVGREFDGGAWPALVGEAAAGEAVEGPNGLLRRVETALGLAAPETSQAERLAALVPVLEKANGYFSTSAQVDPFDTAGRLLSDRDELLLAGWKLQPISERLHQLADLSVEMKPGLPDRLQRAIDTLAQRHAGIESVMLVETETTWPLLWRRLFMALRARGTQVNHEEPKNAAPSGDLLRARERDFVPEGDGSLLLLRGAGPLETADEVAAYLASVERGTTVVVSPDTVLDAALARHGLPTTGAPGRPRDSATLHILPLVLELLWDPPDPTAVYELLGLPLSPIPFLLRWQLRRALGEWPAVRSPQWDEAYRAWAMTPPKDQAEATQRERADLLLKPVVAARLNKVPVVAVLERLDALVPWMRRMRVPIDPDGTKSKKPEGPAFEGTTRKLEPKGKKSKEPAELDDSRLCALSQVERLRSLLKLGGVQSLDRVRLRKLLEVASEGLAPPGLHEAQAGIHAVRAPGAVAGPADTIVWWNFDRVHSRSVRGLISTKAERDGLEALGVKLPSAGQHAIEAAKSWHRPLVSATKRLILCCPRHDEAGESLALHALWDEIEASISNAERQRSARVAMLVHDQAPAPVQRTQRSPRAMPKQCAEWSIGLALSPRQKGESPSSLESLVGCSFKWAAQYGAELYEHPTHTIKLDPRTLGKLAHEVIEETLRDLSSTPDRARKKAERYFDEQGPLLVAELFQPGRSLQRTEVRRAITAAAEGLARFILDTGHTVADIEQELSRDAGGWAIEGRVDLRLAPPAVIDLKYGGRTSKRDALENGVATQLASYAYLVGEGAPPLPPVAYFIVKDQSLLSTEANRFGIGVQSVDGPTPTETWAAFHAAIKRRWAELRDGSLRAPATEGKKSRSKVLDGETVLDAPCQYCEFDALCGRAFAEAT